MASHRYADLDPHVAAFLETLIKSNSPPINSLDYQTARQVLHDLQKASYNTIPAHTQNIEVPYAQGKTVKVTLVRPVNASEALPVALYFHGGGWILGDNVTHDHLVRSIANKAHIAVAFVNYTPSPEAHYQTILDQSYAALEYIASHAKELNLNGNRIGIIGDSAGGTIAATVTLLAKERKGPKISAQVLFYPVTDANFNTPSYQTFAHDFWLTQDAMRWFWDAYAPDIHTRNNYLVAPLHATTEQLRGLPPTLIINAENEVLLDEGIAYARKLLQAQVDVTHIQYLGTIHDFVMLAPLKDTSQAKSAIDVASALLKEKLHS